MKYNSLNQIVGSTNTKYLLKRRNTVFVDLTNLLNLLDM